MLEGEEWYEELKQKNKQSAMREELGRGKRLGCTLQ